jgi:two-component system response regulator RegA
MDLGCHRRTSLRPVLVVDDDHVFLRSFCKELERRGWPAIAADRLPRARDVLKREHPVAAVIDVLLGEESGLDVIEECKRLVPDIFVVVITASASVQTAITALKLGAHEYLGKPVSVDGLIAMLSNPKHRPRPLSQLPLAEVERNHLVQAVEEAGGNISEAARRLRMHRRSLQRKLQKN